MSTDSDDRLISMATAMIAVILAMAWVAIPEPASAQEGADEATLPPLQLQRFRPATGPADYVTVWGSGIMEHRDWHAGGYFNYADSPMQLGVFDRPSETTVQYQSQVDAIAAIGLFDQLELGMTLPWTLSQRGGNLTPLYPSGTSDEMALKRTGLNDIRMNLKYQFQGLHEGTFGLALVGAVSAPVGRRDALTSDEGVGGELLAVGEYVFKETIRGAANLGFRYRPGTRRIQDNILGNEVVWGLGVHSPFLTDDLDIIGELAGALAVQSEEPLTGISSGEVPIEARGALRYGFASDWSITGGMGARMGDGIGAPRWRAFVGISGKWATGGWWRVNYRHRGFTGQTDPCDPRIREQQMGRLRFDPADCPEYTASTDGDDDRGMAWLEEPVESPDPEWFERVQEEGSDEEGGAMLRQGAIIITERVTFETGSADLQEESFGILEDVAALVSRHDAIQRIRVEGHTDSVGDAEMNLNLSEDRAESVRQYMISVGVEAHRIDAIGYGESRPVADNDTEEGRARNRRVEFNIMEMESQ